MREIYDIHGVYERLEERGESFSNGMLDDAVVHVVDSKVAVECGGAICIFPVESAPKGLWYSSNRDIYKLMSSRPYVIMKIEEMQ